ncbi:MAG: DUF1998 domain-containing protein, partial [Ardenticatenales bacterium]|nr:DUF1998 domain-containing protein [Ardenticatenales bacterium]
PEGPRVIPVLALSELFSQQRRPVDFEITDLRLSQALLNGAGILRLPSNAELNELDSQSIYSTIPFPSWALCVKHGLLYRKRTHDNRACPRCGPLINQFEAWKQVRRQAIRFVRACAAGHLDDVDWIRIVHQHDNCQPAYLCWRGGGGALRQIDIVCPTCDNCINLGLAYSREWPCSGRFPEWGGDRPGNCNQHSKIIQRGAANLRISELQTALTIPPRSTPLHRQLEITVVRAILLSQPILSKQALLDALQPLVAQTLLRQAVITEISNHPETEILAAINDTIAGPLPADARSLRLDEFGALRYAATFGAPPQQSSRLGDPHQFEVVHAQVRTLTVPIPNGGGHLFRITPVNRLRVVMVQTGYRRLDPLNDPVDCVYDDGQRDWYPGVELFGEGIFIDLAPTNQPTATARHFPLNGSVADTWFDSWIDPQRYDPRLHPENRDQLHPVFVWWHTLAHRLINALSVDSGYSSAAVRERVFIEIDENTGDAGGGILLYTVQPGGDGTLGGLVALVPQFEQVLESALRNIDACSNDPLCSEETFAPEKYNGAACYACALISETSCEYRNMRLDRNLLLDNLP